MTNKMVKIISKEVVNGRSEVLVDGQMLHGVQSVDIHLEVGKHPTAVIKLIDFELDAELEATIIDGTTPYRESISDGSQ